MRNALLPMLERLTRVALVATVLAVGGAGAGLHSWLDCCHEPLLSDVFAAMHPARCGAACDATLDERFRNAKSPVVAARPAEPRGHSCPICRAARNFQLSLSSAPLDAAPQCCAAFLCAPLPSRPRFRVWRGRSTRGPPRDVALEV